MVIGLLYLFHSLAVRVRELVPTGVEGSILRTEGCRHCSQFSVCHGRYLSLRTRVQRTTLPVCFHFGCANVCLRGIPEHSGVTTNVPQLCAQEG